MPDQRISIIGLGKLGFPFGLCWAHKGFDVIGADRNENRVEALREGVISEYEPRVKEMFVKCKSRFTATTDIRAAVKNSDVTYIFVGTPGEPSGKFTTTYVLEACGSIGSALRRKNTTHPHLVVLVSSVTPGSIDTEIIPALQDASGMKAHDGFDFCYSPVFIALGTMVHDYYNPDIALIGQSNSGSGDRLEALLRVFYDKKDVSFVRTTFTNAEIIKLALSTFITTKISYANMLSQLCNEIPNADVDTITKAIGLDSRVSPKVLKGGLSYGGPCFPRDNRAFMYLARTYGIDGRIVRATDRFNKEFIARIADLIQDYALEDGTVGILGAAFKPDTDVLEESASLLIADALAQRGVAVLIYDPVAFSSTVAVPQTFAKVAPTLESIIKRSDVLVVATPWKDFIDLPSMLRRYRKKKVVVDPWRLFSQKDMGKQVTYICVGKGGNQQFEVEKRQAEVTV